MSSKKTVRKKGLLAKVNASDRLEYSIVQQNIYNLKTELEFEIECPRCYDKMTLCSDFDGLYYFCEQCGFLLHT
ncbi:MAG TPA: hypothetical protein VEH06_09660 [Candidatus Bathyarchaeia archaeon]|nr:hypothetical protein [Candidatus Bathyarchaeia archaeon]